MALISDDIQFKKKIPKKGKTKVEKCSGFFFKLNNHHIIGNRIKKRPLFHAGRWLVFAVYSRGIILYPFSIFLL
jgi:chloramphenicol O-acetyltransferase